MSSAETKQAPWSRWTPAWVAVLLVALAVIVNWPYAYQEVALIASGELNSAVDFMPLKASPPVMAGWPQRFLIRYPAEQPGATTVVRFSAVALALNVAVALASIAVATFYVHHRGRRGTANKISIADLLVLTLVLAAPLGWWQWTKATSSGHQAFADQLGRSGAKYQMSAWIPRPIEPWVPRPLAERLRRLRAVRVEKPAGELVTQLIEQPELTMLRLGGGDYDLRLLDRMAANPHLVDLRVGGRVIDEGLLRLIGSLPRLGTLNLVRTNINAEVLQRFDTVADLQRLGVMHSDVAGHQLGTPPCAQSVRHLWIGHPDAGDTDSLHMDGWPQLETLSIYELDTTMNSTAMQVRLSNLPKLKELEVDVFQRFDLEMRHLPKFELFKAQAFEWAARIAKGGEVPGTLCVRRLMIDDLPELQVLSLYAPALEHYRVTATPKYQMLGVGASHLTLNDNEYATEMSAAAKQALIEGLSLSDGPAYINLDLVPMSAVDLAPLANNRGIIGLMLSDAGTNFEQWKQLEPMTWLRRLDVKGATVTPEALRWVLDTFPNLEHFAFSNSNDSMFSYQDLNLQVIDRPKLHTVDLGQLPTQFFSRVQIVDAPALKMDLKLGQPWELELVNAPALTGLSVEGELPANARISGLRDLTFFAVGGPNVHDGMLETLANCSSLHTLTLAYPGITADALRQFQLGPSLAALHLPGTPLDDEIVGGWQVPTMLTSLDISDTKVTSTGLQRLMAGRNLTELKINRTPIQSDELQTLAQLPQLPQLRSLSLAAVGIEPQLLGELLSNGTLVALDLSDNTLSPEVLQQLAGGAGSLQFLSLRNCTLDAELLAQMAARFPHCKLDLEGVDLPTALMTRLISSGRISTRQEWEMEIAMQAMMDTMSSNTASSVAYYPQPRYASLIDVESFANLGQSTGGAMTIGSFGTPAAVTIQGPPPSNRSTGVGIPSLLGNPGSLGVAVGRWLGGLVAGKTVDPPSSSTDHQTESTTAAADPPSTITLGDSDDND